MPPSRFRVTLLVISLERIPNSIPALIQALKGIPAFAVSFIMIVLFWNAHAVWSRRYGLNDVCSKVLSLTLVFLVLVYVYPLRIQFGMFFNWISGGWLPSPIEIGSGADVAFMYTVYGLAFSTMSLCICGLYFHSWRNRHVLLLDTQEATLTFSAILIYAFFAAVGILSVLLSTLIGKSNSPWLMSIPGMVYFFLTFTGALIRNIAKHRAPAAAAS